MSSGSAAAAPTPPGDNMETDDTTNASSDGPTTTGAGGRSRSASKRPGNANAAPKGGASKGGGGGTNQGPPKKKRAMYEYRLNLWDFRDGTKKPISLADWRVMNIQLCKAAALKLRKQGPPNGGVGQKHWQEHSDGTKKTSLLPETERFGHTVIRFSTADAQNWFEPLVGAVLGTAQDGRQIQLAPERENEDGKARYVFSLPEADFTAYGESKGEREDVLKLLIFGATGMATKESLDLANRECPIYSSFLFQERNKDDMWKMGMKFPFQAEERMDSLMGGETFSVLPTAITNVRVLKKQNSKEMEKKLIQMKMASQDPSHTRSQSTDAKGSGAAAAAEEGEK